MTAPLMAPPPAGIAPTEPVLRPRPGGVTFGCVSSIVLGGLGAMTGLLFLMGGAMLALIPVAGPFLAAFAIVFAVLFGAMGVLGIVAGIQGLNGAAWARWTVVVLHAMGAITTLGGFPLTLPIVGVNVAAIVFLVNQQANEWYAQMAAPRPY